MEQLTILLGSGFSIPFGLPSVADLTKVAESTMHPLIHTTAASPSDNVPAAKMLFRALRSAYADPNFELALHAVESLLSYAATDTYEDDLSAIRQVLRVFTDPTLRWTPLFHFDTLFSLRKHLVRGLVEAVQEADVKRGHDAEFKRSVSFFDHLSSKFSLRCFTLNYDTVADAHLNWNDGFKADGAFSRTVFGNKVRHSEPLLCHMHGSIKFGYDSSGLIVKCPNTSTAVATYSNEKPPKPNQAGELNSAGPIISGLRKLDKLNSTPYGYYYSEFVNCIRLNPQVLVIGYGFQDLHINYWLGQHGAIHGDRRRAVIIDKNHSLAKVIWRDPHPESVRSSFKRVAKQLWRRESGDLDWKYRSSAGTYFSSAQLLALLSGYPVNAETRELIIDHFQS
jgi:hypothetical protein